ncbi:MAG: hypothetical protein H7A37_04985 [Chlamydiales bacterium]|nr:hypothetical protein [Chlamydiia bacterium]MCP5507637.1 hypothetical protein [Chlamydiales bacterium]
MKIIFSAVFAILIQSQLQANDLTILLTNPMPELASAIDCNTYHVYNNPWTHGLTNEDPDLESDFVHNPTYAGIRDIAIERSVKRNTCLINAIWSVMDNLTQDDFLWDNKHVRYIIVVQDPKEALTLYHWNAVTQKSDEEIIHDARNYFRYDQLHAFARMHRSRRGDWPEIINISAGTNHTTSIIDINRIVPSKQLIDLIFEQLPVHIQSDIEEICDIQNMFFKMLINCY